MMGSNDSHVGLDPLAPGDAATHRSMIPRGLGANRPLA